MRQPMNVYLTFDIELWCNSWDDLDGRFPGAVKRYVYGRSAKGDYALPKTLEILDRHGLPGVFFVEPLFAARFGVEHLATIVDLIRHGDHDVELHLHPEWADELRPLPFPGATRKRQHLCYYSLEEQTILLRLGLDLLAQVGCRKINAFRAGSFACNGDTFRALRHCNVAVDSSLSAVHGVSGADLRGQIELTQPQVFQDLTLLPLTVIEDGTGRWRPAQVGSCSFGELRTALNSAYESGTEHFVILSHNFEMLCQKGCDPDRIVVRRFAALCAYLAAERDRFRAATLDRTPVIANPAIRAPLPKAKLGPTLRRHGEQLLRRIVG